MEGPNRFELCCPYSFAIQQESNDEERGEYELQSDYCVTLLDYDEQSALGPSYHAFMKVTVASLVNDVIESHNDVMLVAVGITLNLVAIVYYNKDQSIEKARQELFEGSLVFPQLTPDR